MIRSYVLFGKLKNSLNLKRFRIDAMLLVMFCGITAIAWFENVEDYDALRMLMEDGNQFPDCYYEWLRTAVLREMRSWREDGEIVRVMLKPSEFPAWCALKGLSTGAGGREALERDTEIKLAEPAMR